MSYRYLPEPGAVSSAPSCSDGNQSGTSNGTNTVSKSSRKESKTASSTKPQSSETLTTSSSPVHLKNTRAMSMWLRQAFLAKDTVLRVNGSGKKTRATSGRKRLQSFAIYDLDSDTPCWRTSQVCFQLTAAQCSRKFSQTWPKQGSMRDGVCSEQTMWVPRTDAKDSGLKRLAKTPSAADAYTGNMKKDEFKFGNSGSLAQEVESGFLETHRNWPTPSVSDTEGGQQSDRVEQTQSGAYILRKKNKPDSTFGAKLSDAVLFEEKKYSPLPGKLNPTWVEWLMGWPIGWTDLKPLETDKYQQWLQLHGRS